MAQVKSHLGRDAVILHTRKFRKGGMFGLFAKEMVEVMAAVDTAEERLPEKKQPQVKPTLPPTAVTEDAKIKDMQQEMANMRGMLEQVMGNLQPQAPVAHSAAAKTNGLLEVLLNHEIDYTIAEKMLKGLPGAPGDEKLARQLLADRLRTYLQRIEGIEIPEQGRKVIAFVGPTGVGKTTTIAKLAANFLLKEGCKIVLITADTYRISAVEQLKTYSDIMGVPIEVVYTAEEMKMALYRHQDKHLVLIDTAGRSPKNQEQLKELQALLTVEENIEAQLVLSATTKYKDALEIVKGFSVCSPKKLLFTKLDEASNIGTILSVLYHFPIPLSYVTVGQNVPDDIELADANKLLEDMLRE